MSENTTFTCNCCGEIHEEWPALAFSAPANYDYLSENERESIAYLNSDFCTIHYSDQIDRFIRCTLTQKVNDHCQDLDYGLWVSLSEQSYLDYEKKFKQENEEKTYFGWFCSTIFEYEFSESIPMNVITRNNGERPEIIPHKDFDHPFVKDYYKGITKEEAERRISQMLKIVRKNQAEDVKKKNWWEIWK